MIVIAYASGQNGMTTWCIEAAHALLDNGIDCCLFCDENVNLQYYTDIKTFIIKDSFVLPTTFLDKIKVQIWNRIFRSNASIAYQIDSKLRANNITATHIIWNNAAYLNTDVPIPQSTVAWAYPAGFWSYIKKTKIFAQNQNLKTKILCYLDSIGFYLSDTRGYKNAHSVLAIHNALNKDLNNHKIKNFLIYPSIVTKYTIPCNTTSGKLKIIIAALNIEESRKGIMWMLDCLCHAEFLDKIELHIVGRCSKEFERKYTTILPITFYGLLSRAEVDEKMQKMDLFLFGSTLDDWGFVQTEAMSNGLAVISPNLTPFNEIVPLSLLLFELHSEQSFLDAIKFVLESDRLSLKTICLNTANEKFSRKVFAHKIQQNLKI